MAVYLIQDDGAGYVKIGHAFDPWARLATLQTSTPYGLQIIRIVQGGQKVERWFHRRFAVRRIRGEWFSFDREMMTVVAPDEIPKQRRPQPRYRSIGAMLRAADGMGILSEDMKRDFAPLLNSNA